MTVVSFLSHTFQSSNCLKLDNTNRDSKLSKKQDFIVSLFIISSFFKLVAKREYSRISIIIEEILF